MVDLLPGDHNVAMSQIELHISCSNLKNMDWTSKSDPVVEVYQLNQTTKNYDYLGRTEAIQNNLSPDFATSLKVDYHFEEQQLLYFKVMDVDDVKAMK